MSVHKCLQVPWTWTKRSDSCSDGRERVRWLGQRQGKGRGVGGGRVQDLDSVAKVLDVVQGILVDLKSESF